MQKNFSASAATFDQFPETENSELILQSKNSEQSPQKLIVEFLQFAGKKVEQILENPAVENLLTAVGGNVEGIVALLCKDRKSPPKGKKQKHGHQKVQERKAERKNNNDWRKERQKKQK